MTVVVDASAVVSALVDSGAEGRWAEQILLDHDIVAPALLLVECTNVLRRLTASEEIVDLEASMAHKDLMALPVTLFPFEPFAERVWTLRHNLSSYDLSSFDAWYVALAETLNIPLVTLDSKLANAPGPECTFNSFSG